MALRWASIAPNWSTRSCSSWRSSSWRAASRSVERRSSSFRAGAAGLPAAAAGGPALGRAAKLFLQAGDLGLREVVGNLELLDLLLAGLVLVAQALEVADQLLVELEDLGVRAAGFRWLLWHQA